MTTVIFGPSGSGKTALANYLEDEVDGVDYHFRTMDEFQKLIGKSFFAEHCAFYPHGKMQLYGTAKVDLSRYKKTVLVLEPTGIKQLLSAKCDLHLVYLNEDQSDCILNCTKRGDDILEVARRMAYDLPKLKDFEVYLKMNQIPYQEFQHLSIKEMARRIDIHG